MTIDVREERTQGARASGAEGREPRRSGGLGMSLRRRGRLAVFLALGTVVAGAVAGAVAASYVPVRYTAEVRMAVGNNSLESLSVPSYVQASQMLASNYARYVNTGQDQINGLAGELGVPGGVVESVQASPIENSNILRIVVVADTRDGAQSIAQALAERLVSQVNQAPDDSAQLASALTEASSQLAQAQQAVSDAELRLARAQQAWTREHPNSADEPRGALVEAAKSALVAARASFAVVQVDQQAVSADYRASQSVPSSVELELVRPASVAGDNRSQARQWGALGGVAIAAVLVALLFVQPGRRAGRRS